MLYTVTPDDFPAEITHEVLKWFVLRDKAQWEELRDKRATASTVCRAWRNVVLHNPQYWLNVSLQLCTKPSYTEFCVTKATAGPIALEIDLNRHEDDARSRSELFRGRCMTLSRFLTSTLPLLREAYPRVKSLHIGAPNEQDAVAVMGALSRYGGDSLQSATLITRGASTADVAFATDVQRTPLLTQVLTRSVRPLAFGVNMYKSITDLTVSSIKATDSVTTAELTKALRACESLRVLQLVNVVCSGAGDSQRVVLPTVRRFRLEYEFDESAEVVAALTFPALQELCVEAGPCVSIEALTSTAPALFEHAERVAIQAYTSLACLPDVIIAARQARMLDLRKVLLGEEMWTDGNVFDMAMQLTKLETIWLPSNIPFNLLRILGWEVKNAFFPNKVRLATEGVFEIGGGEDLEWEFDDLHMVASEVEMDEGGEWMDQSDATK